MIKQQSNRSPLKAGRHPFQSQHDPALCALYVATSFLCLSMVLWILLFPASSFQEDSEWRRVLFAKVNPPGSVLFPEGITKYQHETLVQWTHILPGAIWAAVVPIQLHPAIRLQYRTLHRTLGYLFLVTAIVMSYGILVILLKHLTFEDHFAKLLQYAPDSTLSLVAIFNKVAILALALYFPGTAVVAVRAATQGRTVVHQYTLLRHVAAGLWVAIQRVLLVVAAGIMTIRHKNVVSPMQQRWYFAVTAYAGMMVSFGAAEMAIWRLKSSAKLLHKVKKRSV